MRREAAAKADDRTQRPRSDVLSMTRLATIGIVMLAWIAGLVWSVMAFMDWLVS
ncbi:hypothetical protein JQ607_33585 [Bradyrhizobium liaoningense]|uniref:hypothetical protein n=1 Tax=Bradyrhizobium liaoningense TaxID=43992 RepID=UPI001BA913DD|nr:hypothetical protein [Bradyrhizobium liaoningense]MBR0845151.1 hypothetical protein [Bradyrhizobium liaoningense]MBR0855538.1 hypothetical protein [Bradyrhizobium liaoningense]